MRRGEVTMHEFEDERPIPLGRTATATTPRAAPPTPQATEAPIPAAAPELEPNAVAHIGKTREQAAPQSDGLATPPAAVVVAPAAPEPAPAPPAVAVEPSAEEVAAPALAEPVVAPPETPFAPRPAAAHAPDEHPLAGLGGFRFQVELAEPALPVRDLGRFLIAYVVVAAFVLGLIVAFLALTTNLGSGRP